MGTKYVVHVPMCLLVKPKVQLETNKYTHTHHTHTHTHTHTHICTQTQPPLPTAALLADFSVFPLSILSTLLKYENDTEWCISRKLSLAAHADAAFHSTFTRQLLRLSLCGSASS